MPGPVTGPVLTRIDGPVLLVTLSRPERRNAVDRAAADALLAAFDAFDADPALSVAVLCGAGADFCAGADLKAIAAGQPNRLEPDGPAPLGPTRRVLSKPVIAAIQGHAVAGGLELALWCDLRVAEEGATLGVFCRRWGVPLIDGGTQRLPAIIGLGRAMDLILTGRPVDAREALSIGLINRLVAPGAAIPAALALAHALAALPQAAMRADRLSALEWAGADLGAEFRRGVEAVAEGAAGARRFGGIPVENTG